MAGTLGRKGAIPVFGGHECGLVWVDGAQDPDFWGSQVWGMRGARPSPAAGGLRG
jgi:hypothetical protein